MKDINDFTCKRIISEPGDSTRYDYIMAKYYDEYIIMPYKSTFTFPVRIMYFDIIDINTLEDVVEFMEDNKQYKDVNPHTMMEVILTIKELHNATD